ncbi:S8 family serine peptidase [Actinoplanes sp. NBC_00393]|uniref:S8 family serine peptidase n=1 Tax=Actinoplanes sp. NBC_00393 TaxID=2975953 RepID=UPI002E1ED4A1
MRSSHRRITFGLVAVGLAASLGAFGVAEAADTSSPVRLIVGLKAGADAEAQLPAEASLGLRAAGARAAAPSKSRLGARLNAKAVAVPKAKMAAAIAALEKDPKVAYVEVDRQSKAFDVTPNDTLFVQGRQPELRQLNVPKAWDTTTGGAVKVAVLDTGVSPVGDLAGQVLPGYDFFNYDSNPADDDPGAFRHGTIVASLIAAKHNNSAGMAGVCAQCQILPVKVLGGVEGYGFNSDIADGIVYAVDQGAKIINMSLGGPSHSQTIANAVAYANGQGVLVVAAAGNDGSQALSYPAAYPDVLAVGATNTRTGGKTLTSWSNRGSWVDVAAPGITAGMWSNARYCYDGNSTACGGETLQGTSFAAPLVSGIAALVASFKPTFSGWSIQHSIKSATPTAVAGTQYGLVDANAALFKSTDKVAPSAGRTSPGQNQLVHGTVAITSGATDGTGSGIRQVELYLGSVRHSRDYVAPFAPQLKTGSKNGPISLRLKIVDKAGNVTWTGYRTLIADNIKPVVKITKAPANKAKVKGTVAVYVSATDKSGISKVQLLVNGKVVATDTKAGWALSFKVAKQAKTMKVQVRAYDKAGNVTNVASRTYYRA